MGDSTSDGRKTSEKLENESTTATPSSSGNPAGKKVDGTQLDAPPTFLKTAVVMLVLSLAVYIYQVRRAGLHGFNLGIWQLILLVVDRDVRCLFASNADTRISFISGRALWFPKFIDKWANKSIGGYVEER